jgi:hypothetical protein
MMKWPSTHRRDAISSRESSQLPPFTTSLFEIKFYSMILAGQSNSEGNLKITSYINPNSTTQSIKSRKLTGDIPSSENSKTKILFSSHRLGGWALQLLNSNPTCRNLLKGLPDG